MTARFADMADNELLAAFAAGEAAAFSVLMQRYRVPLYNFIVRSVRHRESAADLLQEAFVRVIQRHNEFNREAKFSTWLYVIARNLCVDHSRRMKHRRHASLDAPSPKAPDGEAWVERVAAAQPDLEREAGAGTLRSRLAQAVEELPEEQREVFLMRQIQQLPFAEIATIVGVSENTVKSRMRYALERLQEALSDYEEQARARA